jgi:hypothetical protein
VLVHEATFGCGKEEEAVGKKHSTVDLYHSKPKPGIETKSRRLCMKLMNAKW